MDFVASAVMNKEVSTVPASASLEELESLFVESGLNGFPVVEDGKLVGVVSKTDLVEALQPRASERPEKSDETESTPSRVGDIMTSDVVSVVPNANLHKVADLMFTKRLHRILVVEHGAIMGIITPFDFVRLYASDKIGTSGAPTNPLDF